ncbi:MAG: terminase TerL endonuclease subunit [Pseudomonadota bacterium]
MTYTERALKYAERVIAGTIPACEHVKNACSRFLNDLERDDFAYVYDADRAERCCRFLEKLPHVKGRWAAKKEALCLGDWQVFATCNLIGWVSRATGLRRFRKSYIEVPRKNGKSLWAAGIGLYLLLADNEFGAEVYSGATTEKQAWEVFRPAKQICDRFDDIRDAFGVEVNAKSLFAAETGSRFEPIVGNPGDGASPSCAIVDEFHEHKTSDLVDTMETGMGAREQPLLFIITTAGSDFGGPCYETRSDCIKVLNGTFEDDTVFSLIYTIDEDDDWDTVEALIKANPNYDVSVSAEFLKTQLEAAKRSATKQAAFKTKHLNLWVGAKTAWMNMLAYQRVRRRDLTLADYAGAKACLGLDLASKLDLASLCIWIFGSPHRVFWRHWLPYETVYDPEISGTNCDRYRGWAEAGDLITTDGNVIDLDMIEDEVKDVCKLLDVQSVGYDPYQATQFATHLLSEGIPMVEVGATVKNFSEPMKDIEAQIVDQNIEVHRCPVALWAMSNVVAAVDKKDNIFPNKETADNKIDPIVAMIMARNRCVHYEDTSSIYEQRGLITF